MNRVMQLPRHRLKLLIANKRCFCTFNDEKLSQAAYWTERYQQRSHQRQAFDWFLSGPVVHQLLQTYLDVLSGTLGRLQILDLGCGNSSLPHSLYTFCGEYPVDLHLVDYVAHVLQTQCKWLTNSEKGNPATTVNYVQCDVTRLPYRSESFHLVVDKGTTDAVLKDRNDGKRKCQQLLTGVVDVLQPGGIFLHITDEDPDIRVGLLEKVIKGRDLTFTEHSAEGREYFVFHYKKMN